ncbi:hypothetical protein K439DRAFT_279490 [Ramaria rubella]|nr:hypothetical protein K439DRAFT_279490 [Ramaria rubella]
MDLSGSSVMTLATNMWSTPGPKEPFFTPQAYAQLLSGAIELLPRDTEEALAKLIAVTGNPEHPDIFTPQALERGFELVRKAQGMKENFTLVNFEHPQLLQNSSNPLQLQHFGIPRAQASLFVECMNTCPLKDDETFNKQTAYNYWYNLCKPTCPNYAFNTIWSLLHESTASDAPGINKDGFFIIMYLSEIMLLCESHLV